MGELFQIFLFSWKTLYYSDNDYGQQIGGALCSLFSLTSRDDSRAFISAGAVYLPYLQDHARIDVFVGEPHSPTARGRCHGNRSVINVYPQVYNIRVCACVYVCLDNICATRKSRAGGDFYACSLGGILGLLRSSSRRRNEFKIVSQSTGLSARLRLRSSTPVGRYR